MATPRSPMLPINGTPRNRRTGFDAFTPAPAEQPVSLSNGRALPPSKPMPSAGKFSGPRRSRIRKLALVIILVSGTLMLFSGSSSSNQSSQKDSLFFCPHSTSKRHTPTVILQADGANARTENRTYWVGGSDPAEFLPFTSQPHDLRFLQSTLLGAPQLHHPQLQDHADKPEQGRQLCHVHRVPSSPRAEIPRTWKDSKIMFGMSTTPDRALYSLPVWPHWVPASKERIDLSGHSSAALAVPEILILTHPPNPTEASRITEAVEEAHGLGINVVMRKQEADRFETRYFMLAKEMWAEAQRKKKTHGVETDWFVFCDDDTFFPDWDSVVRMLSEHDPAKPILIGALSEAVHQVKQWGHISYGGAGIFVSRAMLHVFNGPGQIEECLDKFGSAFGGDAMVAHCAALATKKDIQDVLTLDDTLHQLDIRGDGTGFFQSGFLITSLHHWGSWFTIFPPWSESGSGDLRKSISLVGRAAKAVGGDNWGRRYVFEDGKVVVSLGYSISIEARALSESELNRSEHTWWEFETFHPIRPGKHESIEKRTYYLSAVRHLESGVVRLEHKNQENERADVIWDAREGR
ncbi:BQ5605_C042g12004 [Microbotryum silenes-dioicae]|uniref:BQ5605_C042g12004 protein n=1 Tax=Microbotryum silenes-dioicae TaxID=796604 RepID=A0A2X0PIL6_9BASI|nr:BQ5605_C042g12004 [Microbotryum silenes-dioicae]